ncbi:CYP315A1, partial [Cordylochernes scorpioides]
MGINRNGQQWHTRRRMLNKIFLRSSPQHDEVFKEVVEDVLERWRGFSRTGSGVLPGLERELYNWSVESLGMLIFGRRLGCVRGASMNEFVQCVQKIFVESAKMTIIPPKMAYTLGLPVWFRFMKAADRALELAREYVVGNLRNQTGILAEMLQEKDISEEEIVRIVVDLFLAAADTTSHSTQWSLYLLSKNPECQERLYEEIRGLGGVDLDNMPYVRAVVKEALRLYPVAPFLTRFTTNDLELAGFHIPKGKLLLMSLFATSRDPRYFQDPLAFRPERWLGALPQPDAASCHYASIPFGVGPRGCIGRRVAEKQMHLLLSKV